MNRLSSIFLVSVIFCLLSQWAGAGVPKKQQLGRYSVLWSKSPFTVPPEKEEVEAGPGALDDYVLTGVSKLPAGYFVSLMHKKKRDDRITIIPGESHAGGYKVVSVTQDPYNYKETTVRISVNGKTGEIGYDEKYLTLKRAAVAPKKPTKPGARPTPTPRPTPGARRPTPTPTPSSTGRVPRVRRLPTPPKR